MVQIGDDGLMKHTEYSPYKAVHHVDRLKEKRPVLCYWLITSRCNHDCPVCINKYYENFVPNTELGLDALVDLARQMKELGVQALSLSGGEPMLYHRFEELMEAILDLGFDVGIISNGTLIGDVGLDLLSRCKWIRFSVNAMGKESFTRVHRAEPVGYWQKLERALPKLKANGCVVGSSFLVQPANIGDMVAFLSWSKAAGFDTARFSYVRKKSGDIVYSDQEKAAIEEAIQRGSEHAGNGFCIFGLSSRLSLSREKRFDHCYMEDLAFCVAADGKVYRCCSLQHRQLGLIGSVRENSLSYIWSGRDPVDPAKCPMCWHSTKNEFMDYLMSEPLHVNFV